MLTVGGGAPPGAGEDPGGQVARGDADVEVAPGEVLGEEGEEHRVGRAAPDVAEVEAQDVVVVHPGQEGGGVHGDIGAVTRRRHIGETRRLFFFSQRRGERGSLLHCDETKRPVLRCGIPCFGLCRGL